jgi:hypothetical protein
MEFRSMGAEMMDMIDKTECGGEKWRSELLVQQNLGFLEPQTVNPDSPGDVIHP